MPIAYDVTLTLILHVFMANVNNLMVNYEPLIMVVDKEDHFTS